LHGHRHSQRDVDRSFFCGGDSLAADAGSGRSLHRRAQRRAGPHRRAGLGLRYHDGNARACAGGHTRPVSAAGIFRAGLRGHQVCGRRLSDLYRGAADSQPDRSPNRADRAAAAQPGAALSRRLRGQSAESKDGAVLPGIPAAIRRSRARRRGVADCLSAMAFVRWWPVRPGAGSGTRVVTCAGSGTSRAVCSSASV